MKEAKSSESRGYKISSITGSRLPSKNHLKKMIQKTEEKLQILKAQLQEHLS